MLPISNKAKLLEKFNINKEIIMNESLDKVQEEYIESNDTEDVAVELGEGPVEETPSVKSIFKIESVLNTNKDDVKNFLNKEMNLLLINKVDTAVLPFNCFLLEKDNSEFTFVKIKVTDLLVDNVVSKYISDMFAKNTVEVQNNIDFVGIKEDSTPTLVYNYNHSHENELINKDNRHWWVLPDEIVNLNHVCNFKVSKVVCDFFTNNIELIYLYDENNEKIQIPLTLYHGTDEKSLQYNSTFGLQKSDKTALVGPFYYITNYSNAVKSGGWNDKNVKREEGGIIRFAVFPLKTYFFVYHPKISKDDSSDVVKEIEKVTPEYVQKTVQYRDHNGNWSSEYDSAYIGPMINKDTNEVLSEHPYFATKNSNQQIPFSYHMLDLTNFGEQYDNSRKDYQIL